RDFHVTGVQTCALPIFESRGSDGDQHPRRPVAFVLEAVRGTRGKLSECSRLRHDAVVADGERDLSFEDVEALFLAAVNVGRRTRSEERRVGQERRGGWW